jgi:hypothetical protein
MEGYKDHGGTNQLLGDKRVQFQKIQESGITDDERLCGNNMTFCSKHLRCELLPPGIDRSQIPEGVCPGDTDLIDDECGPGKHWDAEQQNCVSVKQESICNNCGGYL